MSKTNFMENYTLFIHGDHEEMVRSLSCEEKGKLIEMLLDPPDEVPRTIVGVIFTYITQQNERFKEMQEDFSDKQTERGKKGGAPVGNQNAKKQHKNNSDELNQLNQSNQPTVPVPESESVPESVADTSKENNNIINNIITKEKNNLNKKFYAKYVSMDEADYKFLCNKITKQGADWCIEKLDNYKGATGKKYQDDYKAILTWVVAEWEKQGRAGRYVRNEGYSPEGRTPPLAMRHVYHHNPEDDFVLKI
jgi:hypothetical protein